MQQLAPYCPSLACRNRWTQPWKNCGASHPIGRDISKEGNIIADEQAELTVTIACAVCIFLAKKDRSPEWS